MKVEIKAAALTDAYGRRRAKMHPNSDTHSGYQLRHVFQMYISNKKVHSIGRVDLTGERLSIVGYGYENRHSRHRCDGGSKLLLHDYNHRYMILETSNKSQKILTQ